ncbi:unnamed protein product, partial [Discosporangium mesarthrocarpum]
GCFARKRGDVNRKSLKEGQQTGRKPGWITMTHDGRRCSFFDHGQTLSSGKKRDSSMIGLGGQGAEHESDESDTSSSYRVSSRPKKRFVWPDSLHRDFITAVFDVGLKVANGDTIAELLPNKERADPMCVKSSLQKMRSFRYQMRHSQSGDNNRAGGELSNGLLTQQGLANTAVAPGSLQARLMEGMPGSLDLSKDPSSLGATLHPLPIDMLQVIQMPPEVQNLIQKLDNEGLKHSIELVSQCVQVQRSTQESLLHAIQAQETLYRAILSEVTEMGLPFHVDEAIIPANIQGVSGASVPHWVQGQSRTTNTTSSGSNGPPKAMAGRVSSWGGTTRSALNRANT